MQRLGDQNRNCVYKKTEQPGAALPLLRKSCFAMSGVQQGKKIRSFKYITCPQFQKMPGALDILKIISEKLKKQVKKHVSHF
jgi:hypothetical protein